MNKTAHRLGDAPDLDPAERMAVDEVVYPESLERSVGKLQRIMDHRRK